MLGWMKHKLEPRLPGEMSITSEMQTTPPLWQKARGTRESLLMKVKEEQEKAYLKLNIQKTNNIQFHHFMATQWGNNGNSDRLYFWDSKITADGDQGHGIKRHLTLGRKAVTNLDSLLESRDITLPTNVRLVKAMVFLVVMYGCETWTIKKAEC